MGCYYRVSGQIPITEEFTQESLASLVEDLQTETSDLEIVSEGGGRALRVHVADYMSYSGASGVDDIFIGFANKYASAGAVLQTECDGERGELIVAPIVAARKAAEIVYCKEKIREWQKRLDAVRRRNP